MATAMATATTAGKAPPPLLADGHGAASAKQADDVLLRAAARQEERLRAAQTEHGEFAAGVSEDLAQLALLLIMGGELERALPLLHRRLVIHEKYGPEELVGEALQELGTVYRLHGAPEVARQHLTRALAIRKACHGGQSLKVAETLNSLALVHQAQSDAPTATELQLQSLQVLHDNSESEDMESEEVPWEAFKRLKRQRGPSTAANSVVLFKGNLRKAVSDALFSGDDAADRSECLGEQGDDAAGRAAGTNKDGLAVADSRSADPSLALGDLRTLRSKSDSAMRADVGRTGGERELASPVDELDGSRYGEGITLLSGRGDSAGHEAAQGERGARQSSQMQLQPITDFAALHKRVEHVKRRVAAGLPDSDSDVAQLEADVKRISSLELRSVGDAMLSLVRELQRLRVRSDAARQLPVLEGVLEKKSASIFRGWEKRWFKVDPKTFVLSYHFSRDDDARGFAPRGGFAISRVSSILVHRHARGSFFHFDVVVDLSTRSNPHGSRTYELRCEDEETLRYWVDTLHYYKSVAQSSPPRPSTG